MIKKFLLGLFAIIIGVVGIAVVLASENALVVHPKGIVAESEWELILINFVLMLIIIVPTYLFLFVVIWKYCIQQKGEHNHKPIRSALSQWLMWGLPSLIVAIMAFITWEATHRLNPYKPLQSDIPALEVQVIALDWKWLFIYPEFGIATLNYLHIPEQTPIHLRLTADGSPMNSFWIPQLSGQIYSMTGMSTQLYLMANAPGNYAGRAVEINGEGYADMTFSVKSTSRSDFEAWVSAVKESPFSLTESQYHDLKKPSINKSIILFSEVENDLYHKVVHGYMYPAKDVL